MLLFSGQSLLEGSYSGPPHSSVDHLHQDGPQHEWCQPSLWIFITTIHFWRRNPAAKAHGNLPKLPRAATAC